MSLSQFESPSVMQCFHRGMDRTLQDLDDIQVSTEVLSVPDSQETIQTDLRIRFHCSR
jgi:hypothetical protein